MVVFEPNKFMMSQLQTQRSMLGSVPGSAARRPRPNVVSNLQGLPGSGRARLKKQVRIRYMQLNLGTMTGKGRELVDLMERRMIDVAFLQELKWKGEKSKELGEGVKLIYMGKENKRNGVGIAIGCKHKQGIIEADQKSDRLTQVCMVMLMHEQIVNLITAYAPQVALPGKRKRSIAEMYQKICEEYIRGRPKRPHW